MREKHPVRKFLKELTFASFAISFFASAALTLVIVPQLLIKELYVLNPYILLLTGILCIVSAFLNSLIHRFEERNYLEKMKPSKL